MAAKKLMMEIALSNFSTKGWLDGVSLRPSGVSGARRRGHAAKNGFHETGVLFAIRDGEDITLPVDAHSRTWITSVDCVAREFCAWRSHSALAEALGAIGAFTLPALCVTFEQLVAAPDARFPDSKSKVTYAPVAELVALFGKDPHLENPIADRLGFQEGSRRP